MPTTRSSSRLPQLRPLRLLVTVLLLQVASCSLVLASKHSDAKDGSADTHARVAARRSTGSGRHLRGLQDDCVECTNFPTPYMETNGINCFNYTYAYTDRCNNAINANSWWGVNGTTRHCAYSCWVNGVGYEEESPCCPRSVENDAVVPAPTPVATPRPTMPKASPETCVECTNYPTPYMINNGESCATYDYGLDFRCNREGSWWGVGDATAHCAYSCWKHGVGYPQYSPCCARSDADDDVPVEDNTGYEVVYGELYYAILNGTVQQF